jgi:hypothetical protein
MKEQCVNPESIEGDWQQVIDRARERWLQLLADDGADDLESTELELDSIAASDLACAARLSLRARARCPVGDPPRRISRRGVPRAGALYAGTGWSWQRVRAASPLAAARPRGRYPARGTRIARS